MAATFHAVGKGEQTTTQASFSITTTISAGDFLVVVSSWDSASTTTPTVVTTGGTGSDTGTLILGPITAASFGLKYGAWLVSSAGTGRTGVTVSWASSSPSFADGYCWSASGLTTPTLDKSPHTDGNSTNPSSGSTGTLSTSDQFAVSYAASASTIVGATGGGFTDDGNTGSTGSKGGHQVVAVNTALTGSFTAATSAWAALALTIQSGGAAAAPFYKLWDRPQYDIPSSQPQQFVRDPSKFTNPIPFQDQQQRHTRQVPLVGPPQSLPLNINLFTNPIPFSQTDWTPQKPFYRVSQQTQPYNNSVYVTTVVASPFYTQDFATSHTIPDWAPSPQYTNLVLQNFSTPFYTRDFSKPFVPTSLKQDQQQLNVNLFTNPIPFGPFSFPPINAVQGKASDVVQPWQNFYTVITAPPFAQYDWSTTRFQTPRAPDASQPFGVSQLTGSTQFMLFDWSGSGYTIRSNRSFDQPYNQSLYGVVVQAAPFIPVDFSRPFAIPLAKVDVQSVNTNLFTNPVPLNQIDWSKPYRIVPIASDQNSLPNIILYQPVPSNPSNPLGIYSWADLYKYVTLHPNTPALLPNLTLILPPPPDTGPVGGWRWIDGVMRMREKQLDRRDQNASAVMLGKLGGLARAQSLTTKQRSNIASKAAQVRWNPPAKRR